MTGVAVPLLAGAAAAVAVLVVVGWGLRARGPVSGRDLARRLAAYGPDAPGPTGRTVPDGDPSTRLVRDMVDLTGRVAERVGALGRVTHALDQADVPLRAPEALLGIVVASAATLVGATLLVGPVAGVAVAGLVGCAPVVVVGRRRSRRLRAFEAQLPDVLHLLSGSLRAGFSFAQGLAAVVEETAEPSRRALERALRESRLGRPVEDALEDVAARMESVDLAWAVMAIRIQREVGGNLAELLDTVADTMVERERLRQEVLALTAEARLSAWVLGVFPLGCGVALSVAQPDYMATLFRSPVGVLALGASALMAVAGFVWLRRIMAIEV